MIAKKAFEIGNVSAMMSKARDVWKQMIETTCFQPAVKVGWLDRNVFFRVVKGEGLKIDVLT